MRLLAPRRLIHSTTGRLPGSVRLLHSTSKHATQAPSHFEECRGLLPYQRRARIDTTGVVPRGVPAPTAVTPSFHTQQSRPTGTPQSFERTNPGQIHFQSTTCCHSNTIDNCVQCCRHGHCPVVRTIMPHLRALPRQENVGHSLGRHQTTRTT